MTLGLWQRVCRQKHWCTPTVRQTQRRGSSSYTQRSCYETSPPTATLLQHLLFWRLEIPDMKTMNCCKMQQTKADTLQPILYYISNNRRSTKWVLCSQLLPITWLMVKKFNNGILISKCVRTRANLVQWTLTVSNHTELSNTLWGLLSLNFSNVSTYFKWKTKATHFILDDKSIHYALKCSWSVKRHWKLSVF